MPLLSGEPYKLAAAILKDWRRRNLMRTYGKSSQIVMSESVLLEDIARHLQDYQATGQIEVESEEEEIRVIVAYDWENPSLRSTEFYIFNDEAQLKQLVERALPIKAKPYVKMPGEEWYPCAPEGYNLDAIWKASQEEQS